ncbi:MAG TPA: type 1 glutamine amidotransferase domain-containing protein [Candidatus Dormibacteraeota bacterium]|jgi:protease I|nr:type 1 glutamine amidotransferase domain-containing protein [Candidatus Dormibacteraeota bacterium]
MRVACLIGDFFEASEFQVPREGFQAAGHDVVTIGADPEVELHAVHGPMTWHVEASIDSVSPDDFDALLIPGGYSPDKIRSNDAIVAFTKSMVEAGKPTFSICHGPWLLITADVVAGRHLTACKQVRSDLGMVGAIVSDEEVVVDRNLVTSRKPDDLPAFLRESLKLMATVPA